MHHIDSVRMAILGELLATCILVGACGAGSTDSTDSTTLVANNGATPAALAPVAVNVKLSQLPVGYVQCAGEWSGTTCNFAGDVVMVYGTTGSYLTGDVQGPFNCNTANSVIGDPAPGIAKACYVPETAMSLAAVAAPAPAPMPAPGNVGTSGVLTSASFSATSSDFANPDRGFYGWSGGDFVASFDSGSVQAAYNAGQRLVLAKIQLNSYRTSDLPASFLSTLGTNFAALRSAGMKATLWFSYDNSAGGNDATAAQIKRHLEQLRPVLASNADVIPYMRAGFIGAWGEWHSSQSGNSCGYNSGTTTCAVADANRAIVRDALFANVPSTTQIAFRYPTDLQKWYPSATQQRRAGVHNDCFLAGPSDSGTYQNTSQRPYVQALTDSAAFGGETCDNAEAPVRNTCADILSEGAQYHLAWLNAGYAASVLNAWKTGGCFTEVSRSMGYRLQLDALNHATQVTRGGSVAVAVDLRNVGWARMFSARKLVVTLKHKTSGATITGGAGDLQTLAPQATASTRLTIGVTIPSGAQTGDYDVYLSAPDVFPTTASNPKFAVRFANADSASLGQTWDGGAAMFKAGTTLNVN